MWKINFDAIEDAMAKKFFEEHVKKLPEIPKEPFKREEIRDPSKPLPLKRRIVLYMNQKDYEKQTEYDSRPDVMTFDKFYPQPGRNEMLLKAAKDPELQHLPLADRIKFGFDKMYQAFEVANPDYVFASFKITTEVHNSLFGTDEELMGEMIQLYHENPAAVLPFIKGGLNGDEYWEKIYELHISLCKRNGIPHLQIPDEIPEEESTKLCKIAIGLIDDLDELIKDAKKSEAKKEQSAELDAADKFMREEFPEIFEDWDEHFNVKRDPYSGSLIPFHEGLRFVHNPYKSDYNDETSKEKEPEPVYDWKAMREKMDRDFEEWLKERTEKNKAAEEKKKKEDEETEKRKKEKEEDEAIALMKKVIAERYDPVTGKPIGFSCHHDLPDDDMDDDEFDDDYYLS